MLNKIDSSYKYLIKNIGLLTISNFGSKILSFVLIPLYTGILTTVEYGTYDLYSTTISLVIPILTINIVSSVLRFSLDKDKDKNVVLTTSLKICLRATVIFFIILVINYFFDIISIFNRYPLLLFLYFTTTMFYDVVCQFVRGVDRIRDLAIGGIINSSTMLFSNIIFLMIFKLGLKGYFLANILSYVLPLLFLIFKVKIWKYIAIKKIDNQTKMEMLVYSKPMIFNTIAWWINNVSDRYLVTWLCGVSANGIYSVAYKIPSILNVFQSIFDQAWILSAVKEYENGENFYSQIYQLYNCSLIIICSLLIILDRIIAKILFVNEFYSAWQYAPFLMLSVLFGSLSGFIGGIFSAAKQSKLIANTTIIGAVINIILNVILIIFLGPIGAAISTFLSYFTVWLFRFASVQSLIKINTNLKKDFFAYTILIIQIIVLLKTDNIVILYLLEIGFFSVIIFSFRNEFKKSIKKCIKLLS